MFSLSNYCDCFWRIVTESTQAVYSGVRLCQSTERRLLATDQYVPVWSLVASSTLPLQIRLHSGGGGRREVGGHKPTGIGRCKETMNGYTL